MRHYFFDIHDGIEVIDDQGFDLPDIGAARAYALKKARAYTTQPGMLDEDGGAVVVTVRDDAGTEVLAVRLVFTIEAGAGGRRAA